MTKPLTNSHPPRSTIATAVGNPAAVLFSRLLRWPLAIHRDESGSISVVSVFAVILLAMLLGMIVNSGLQVDQKVKMQNAADAATYSGCLVVSRNLNTLAFTNHLLADVFALTAFMREAQARTAENLTVPILDNWERIGPPLAGSEFVKFSELGKGIMEKVPRERDVVQTYGDWAAAASEMMLPVFEDILAEQRIRTFQRALVATTPQIAQAVTDEVARRHGQAWPRPTAVRGALWCTTGERVGSTTLATSGVPVVDPVPDEPLAEQPDPGERPPYYLPDVGPDGLPWDIGVNASGPDGQLSIVEYIRDAKRQRFELAHTYLRQWNDVSLPIFDRYAKMSQFGALWRIFTGGQLRKLLEVDYPNKNLPFQIFTRPERVSDLNRHLEENYMFVGVVYRGKMADQVPAVFHNPVTSDTQAYSQGMIYVPQRRLIKIWVGPGGWNPGPGTSTGIPGQDLEVGGPPTPPVPPRPPQPPPRDGDPPDDRQPLVVRQDPGWYPDQWTLVCQNWSTQLVPATAPRIPEILSSPPELVDMPDVKLPNLSQVTAEDFQWLSNH